MFTCILRLESVVTVMLSMYQYRLKIFELLKSFALIMLSSCIETVQICNHLSVDI